AAGPPARRLPVNRPDLRIAPPQSSRRIPAISGVRAERVVPNEEVVGPIDSSDEWIRQRTGIIERRRASEDQTLADMPEEAGRKALADARVEPSQVDAVIVSTGTPLAQTPALSAVIAERIGATPAAALDISA